MALAVKNPPESTTRTGTMSLAAMSLLGALYVLIGIAIVAQAIPRLWAIGVSSWMPASLSFVEAAGLIIVILFAIGALVVFAMTLVGPSPPAGLRAGVFLVLLWFAITACIAIWGAEIAGWLTGTSVVALGTMIVLAVAMLAWGWLLLSRPKAPRALEEIEAQGWFSMNRYKPMQGLRVRRATMLGLLVMLGSGVWVLNNHGSLGTVAPDWVLHIPYVNVAIPILPDVAITLPIILAVLSFWVSFRLVNWPIFADFLIATEAEVNKISWASRKSVVQDTVVVLATVFLLTVFLFCADLIWGFALKQIGIIQLNSNKPAETQTAEQVDW